MPSWPTGTSSPGKGSWPTGTNWPTATSWPAGAAALGNPTTIVTSLTAGLWIRADLGCTAGSWLDQTVNARNFSQGTGSLQPTVNASGGPNNQAYVSPDGTDDYMTSTFLLGAPGTVSTFWWAICRPRVFSSAKPLLAGNSATRHFLGWGAASPNMRANSGTLIETAATLNGWSRLENARNNSAVTDYLKVGASTTGTGTATGLNPISAGTGISLFALNNGTSPGAIDLAELVWWPGIPTGAELTALDAYASARYGAGVLA